MRAYAPTIGGAELLHPERPDWPVELLAALEDLARFGGRRDDEPEEDGITEADTGIPQLII